jgi:flagellar biosynthesis protein FlhB
VAGADKTEKATPRRREEARKKGQVARSTDLNGAAVLVAALFALGSFGPGMAAHCREALRSSLLAIADPGQVSIAGIGPLLTAAGSHVGLAVAPIAGVCLVTGILVNVAQVGVRPTTHALKPDPKRLNPAQGLKNLFGPNALVEAGKTVVKVLVVGVVAYVVLVRNVDGVSSLVGVGPDELGVQLVSGVSTIARWGAFGWLGLALADYGWQRRRHEKGLRMDPQEVKDEQKQQQLPGEVRSALRRRQMEAARARMMAAVPQADVVVTNPTHFAVALKYDPAMAAPQVVAKGQDLLAQRIRELAAEAGVPLVPDPPLARTLHASVEVGRQIPEELYHGVAQVLAFVYRTAARRRAA